MLHVCFDACAFYVFYHAWISGVPDPPVILNVTVLSARSVFLTWNTTSAQSSANYSVEFSNDSFTWKNATCNQSSVPEACIVRHSEAMVSWLKPYTNYTFRVAAENSFGRSNYSGESKLILTDEAGNCLPHGIFFFFLCINFNKFVTFHYAVYMYHSLWEIVSVVAHTVGSGLKMKKKKIIIISGDMIAKGDSFATLHLKCPLRWLCLLAQCTGKSMHVPIMVQGQGEGVVVGLYPLGVLLFLVCHTLFKII